MKPEAEIETDLLEELERLRRRNAELEALEVERQHAREALAQRERELRATNSFLEHIIATSPAVIFEGDPNDGHRTKFVSPNVEWIRGYTREEILADPDFWVDHIHPEDREWVLDSIEQAIAACQPFLRAEYRFRHKDGDYRWFYDAVHYEYDDQGNFVRSVGCQLDVTERKLAAEALRESEERFRILFENSPDGIFLIDPHYPDGMWRIVDCNPIACRMNGYARKELVGQPLGLLDVGPHEPGGDQVFLQELRRRGTIRQETLHRRKDGVVFPIEFSICFITLHGRELILGIDRDITERKRAEAERIGLERELMETQKQKQIEAVLRQNEILREVDLLKSDFIANISHELRNPLNHIKGYTSLLLQRNGMFDSETTQGFIQTIADAGDRLARLVNDLLDTSRIETGGLALTIEPIAVFDLIHPVVRRWRSISTHRFTAELSPDMPIVRADRGRIEQVLDNLLANIVQHTPEGTSAVVSVVPEAAHVTVCVRDNGPGVEANHLARLFDRFYQADRHLGPQRGSGLGLFICKGIVEQHGGRIWAETTPGSGTTFCFTLPCDKNDHLDDVAT